MVRRVSGSEISVNRMDRARSVIAPVLIVGRSPVVDSIPDVTGIVRLKPMPEFAVDVREIVMHVPDNRLFVLRASS